MTRSIGETIKHYRKKCELTQEELAELLSVTSQAVSKWECESSLPDISQITPLSRILGISCDELLGADKLGDQRALCDFVNRVQSDMYDANGVLIVERMYSTYKMLSDKIYEYPNNAMLLSNTIELGLAIAYPQNDCYDADHADEIYADCVRFSKRIYNYSESTNDILRARYIMLLLHSARGNITAAREEAEHFPERADLILHNMMGTIAHLTCRHKDALESYERGLHYLIEAMLDTMVYVGCTLYLCERYNDAIFALEAAKHIIDAIFSKDVPRPPIHIRDSGDINLLLAECNIKLGDEDGVIRNIESALDYELIGRSYDGKFNSPLFEHVHPYPVGRTKRGNLEVLRRRIFEIELDEFAENERFKEIISRLDREISEA